MYHIGCIVSKKDNPIDRFIVIKNQQGLETRNLKNGKTHIFTKYEVTPSFQEGDWVYHTPTKRIVKVLAQTSNRNFCIVQSQSSEQPKSLPISSLSYIRSPKDLWVHGSMKDTEQLRLYNLAYALQFWDRKTGSLSSYSCDPLPHQIHLVHKLLASGQFNWMIADDVGLGKTIEVGMLIWVLQNKHRFKRILIVSPAGLTKQWQEELSEKFNLDKFFIYGTDFQISHERQWDSYPMVIGSIDLLKNHQKKIELAEDWDLIIVDEAHKMTRKQSGLSYKYSDRYRLGQLLRQKTQNLLMLTATPHQGREDLFTALLELLHPEYKFSLQDGTFDPELLRSCIHRSRKSNVTDMQGNKIFKGQTTFALELNINEAEKEFDILLQKYLKQGYDIAKNSAVGTRNYAIGFVMTIYRKLAASSCAAIVGALRKRYERLINLHNVRSHTFSKDYDDERFSGEMEEKEALNYEENLGIFFENEPVLLEELIEKADALVQNDRKLKQLIDEVIESFPDKKLVIFTEYRNTQKHIVEALSAKYGTDQVVQINGSMSLNDKRNAVQSFNDNIRFIVSTEAGGEGINLHYHCHFMVNYDLPWNPMRLVQRIGRLYRYGQEQTVYTFNMHTPQTIDSDIIQGIYERLDRVVKDLAPIGDEFHSGIQNEIFGEIASFLDIRDIVKKMKEGAFIISSTLIDDAVEKAQEAKKQQDALLSYVDGFTVGNLKEQIMLDHEHVKAFVIPMLRNLGCEIRKEINNGHVVEVKLTEKIAKAIKTQNGKQLFSLCFELGYKRKGTDLFNKRHPLWNYLISHFDCLSFQDKQGIIPIQNNDLCGSTVLFQWQDETGNIVQEDLVALFLREDGTVYANTSDFVSWLKMENCSNIPYQGSKEEYKLRRKQIQSLEEGIDNYMNIHTPKKLMGSNRWMLSVYSLLS